MKINFIAIIATLAIFGISFSILDCIYPDKVVKTETLIKTNTLAISKAIHGKAVKSVTGYQAVSGNVTVINFPCSTLIDNCPK